MNGAVHICLCDQSRLLFDGRFEQFCHFAEVQASCFFLGKTAVAGNKVSAIEELINVNSYYTLSDACNSTKKCCSQLLVLFI